jgi:hypothetical protein
VVAEYAKEGGQPPKVFLGSSTGASQFGHLRLRRPEAWLRGLGAAVGSLTAGMLRSGC